MSHTLRHTVEQLRMRRVVLGQRRLRTKRLPRQLQPDLVRVEYFKAIRAYLDRARAMVERDLLPELPRIVRAAGLVRADAGGDDANRIMDEISRRYFEELRPGEIEALGRRIAGRTADFQREQLSRQVRAAFGVDVFHAEPNLGARIREFTAENVALIKSVPNKYFDDIEKTVTRGVREGMRHEEIADELVERYGVAESSAKLIARDQVGKFYAEVNEERQRALGVEGYIWRNVNDNRVREAHEELNGERFTWESGGDPVEGHPGEAINCRCWAEPDFNALVAGLTND